MALIPSPPRLPALISFLPDSVGVFQNYEPVFKQAKPMDISVKEDSKVMEHPLENGSTIIDHRIILPIVIDIVFILPVGYYYTIYETMKQFFLNGTLLSVQTRSSTYTNMFIKSMPHKENAEMYDRISMSVRFEEVQFAPEIQSQVVSPTEPANSDTVDRGVQQPTPVSENPEGSVNSGLFDLLN